MAVFTAPRRERGAQRSGAGGLPRNHRVPLLTWQILRVHRQARDQVATLIGRDVEREQVLRRHRRPPQVVVAEHTQTRVLGQAVEPHAQFLDLLRKLAEPGGQLGAAARRRGIEQQVALVDEDHQPRRSDPAATAAGLTDRGLPRNDRAAHLGMQLEPALPLGGDCFEGLDRRHHLFRAERDEAGVFGQQGRTYASNAVGNVRDGHPPCRCDRWSAAGGGRVRGWGCGVGW